MSTTPSPFDSNSERSPLKLDRPAEGNELVIETGDSEDEEEIEYAEYQKEVPEEEPSEEYFDDENYDDDFA